MEFVASAASVTQLLGQAITLIQEIQQARETVSGYPKLIHDYSKQLNDLRRTLALVQQEKELQTSGVVEQVATVHSLAQELEAFLAQMTGWRSKNTARQYAHAIFSGKKDEKSLAGVLDRLDRAKNDLVARILLAQVGLTGNLHDGFAATLPVVRRIDQNVQSILGSGLLIATQLEDRQDYSDDGITPLSESDLKAIGMDTPANTGQDERVYIKNLSIDQAQMIMGDVGAVKWREATKVEYRENEARGNSLQVLGGMDSQSFQALLSSRK